MFLMNINGHLGPCHVRAWSTATQLQHWKVKEERFYNSLYYVTMVRCDQTTHTDEGFGFIALDPLSVE